MPKFLEDKLKKKYGKDSKTPYKIMNSLGFMRGNKETSKGREAEKKHKLKGLGHDPNKPQERKKKKKSFSEALNGD